MPRPARTGAASRAASCAKLNRWSPMAVSRLNAIDRARSSAAPREAETIRTPPRSSRAPTHVEASRSLCAESDASMMRSDGRGATQPLSPRTPCRVTGTAAPRGCGGRVARVKEGFKVQGSGFKVPGFRGSRGSSFAVQIVTTGRCLEAHLLRTRGAPRWKAGLFLRGPDPASAAACPLLTRSRS